MGSAPDPVLPSPWRSVEEAALHCRVSRSTLERAVRSGDGPRVHHVGARRVFHIDDLDSWIKQTSGEQRWGR